MGQRSTHAVEQYRQRFDALFERGAAAVLSGTHYRDSPPADGGRWGVSVVLVPDAAVTRLLTDLTAQVMTVAGRDHWPTGNPGAVHLTVRALDAHRHAVPPDDPLVAPCGDTQVARCGNALVIRSGDTLGGPCGDAPVDRTGDTLGGPCGDAPVDRTGDTLGGPCGDAPVDRSGDTLGAPCGNALVDRSGDALGGPCGDAPVGRWGEALTRAATGCRPVRLRLSGLTLTPSGVVVCAYPADDGAGTFATRLRHELGADGWFEARFDRDIWYATLVHFAAAIVRRAELTEWVAQRRDEPFGEAAFGHAELVRFVHNGRQPMRVRLVSAAFTDS